MNSSSDSALALLTCVPNGCDPILLKRLPACLTSLEESGYAGKIFIIDDGSSHPEHVRYLQRLDHQVIYRINGGIWRAKNTALRVLEEHGVNEMFLAEDDLHFQSGWFEAYQDAYHATDIHHFSWAWDKNPDGMEKQIVSINKYRIARSTELNGALLFLTSEVLRIVGGFIRLPYRWGYTHVNWTRRIIEAGLAPFFADVMNSNDLVQMGPYGNVSSISTDERERAEDPNSLAARVVEPIYQPYTE